MTPLELTVPVPGAGPTVMALPQPLKREALHAVERAFGGAFALLRHDLHDGLRYDLHPAALDAGAIEYASWAHHLQPGRP